MIRAILLGLLLGLPIRMWLGPQPPMAAFWITLVSFPVIYLGLILWEKFDDIGRT